MKRVVLFSLGVMVAMATVGVGVRGQQSPDKTVAALKPADGLTATLFASEPMMSNPTNIAVDERGRVWVLEGVNYRRAARNQPDFRPAGDRIVILEDTNQDGKADKVKVFDQNPNIRVPLGIAVLGDKVYVSQAPDITVYTKDANDNIIKKEVLLTGFNGVDHDHGLHAVVFGPDGKYYFNQGNTGFDVTDKSGKRFNMQVQAAAATTNAAGVAVPAVEGRPGYFQGAVFRMNGDGTNLEVIGQNFRNPYEVALDSFGNVYQTDNDDDGNAWTRLLYNMEGGNYGFRGPLNRTWTEDRGTHWHEEVPGVAPVLLRLGAGSPCGLVVYEGSLLPAKYSGTLFHAEAGKRIIAAYTLANQGAGFTATTSDLLNSGEDTWSRPSDVAVGPDGSVYVADWYDPGVGGHQMGDPEGGMGRVYRVAPAGNTPKVPALNLTTDAGLTAAFGSPNQDVQFLAYTAMKAKGQAAVPLLQGLWRQTANPVLRARALWILGGLGAPGQAAIQEALKDSDAKYRVLGLRVAKLHNANMLATVKPMLRDASPAVRREIALMLQDPTRMLPPYEYTAQVQPAQDWLDAIMQIADQYDGRDRWYLEAINIAARGREEAIYARLKAQPAGALSAAARGQLLWGMRPKTAIPDLVAVINNPSAPAADRTLALDTLGAMSFPEATSAIETFIVAAATPPALAEHAFGLYSHQLFSWWMSARTSPALPTLLRKAFTLPGAQAAAVTVADALGDAQYVPDLMTLAKSASATPEARAGALEAVSNKRDARYLADFEALAEANGPLPVRVAAVRAVTNLAQPDVQAWGQRVVLSDAPNEVRTEALRLLASNVGGLNAILDLAEKGSLPPELMSLARNLTNNAMPSTGRGRGGAGNPVAMRAGRGVPTDPAYVAIRARAAKALPMPSVRIPTAFELDLSYRGTASDGMKVFNNDAGCAACHALSGPQKLGPTLSAIGAKYDKQAMLDNIINPSDAVGPEYITTMFSMKNGDTIAGLVVGETAAEVTVQTSADQQQRLKPADIASRQQIRVSSMPEGLLSGLSLQQIADLLEFLSTLK